MNDPQVTRLQSTVEGEILGYIQSHSLKKGDRLPSQEEFSRALQISRATLREALARLVNQGIIRQIHGIGTFVNVDPFIVQSSAEFNISMTESIQSMGMVPGTSEVKVSIEPLPRLAHFDNAGGEAGSQEFVCLRRVRTADGKPFAYTVAYLPAALPGLDRDPRAYPGSLYVYLQEKCGQLISGSDTIIEAQLTSEETSRKLNLARKTPILVLYQQHFNQNGETVIYSIDSYVNYLLLKVKRRGPGLLG